MATMVSAAHSGMGGDILVPPDGMVKLKDKTIPVIEQVRGFVGGPVFVSLGADFRRVPSAPFKMRYSFVHPWTQYCANVKCARFICMRE